MGGRGRLWMMGVERGLGRGGGLSLASGIGSLSRMTCGVGGRRLIVGWVLRGVLARGLSLVVDFLVF